MTSDAVEPPPMAARLHQGCADVNILSSISV
jgi:hypothetical protein